VKVSIPSASMIKLFSKGTTVGRVEQFLWRLKNSLR